MPSYTCKRCKKVWSSEEIAKSISDYGFINFTGQNEEIIGFSCPDGKCLSLIALTGPIGVSTHEIYAYITDFIDSHGNFQPGNKFYYSSTCPLSKSSLDILSGFDVVEFSQYTNGYENDLALFTSERPELATDYFCSFNSKHNELFGTYLTIWWYKKDDLQKIIEVERSQGLRLFPRYVKEDDLLERVDRFCWKHHLEKALLAESTEMLRPCSVDSWSKENIAIQFDFLELLTPPRYIFGKENASLISKHNKSDSIWKNFHSRYIQEQLSLQSELFVRDYLQLYSKTTFCLSRIEELVSRYRSEIYVGLNSRRKRELAQKNTLSGLISRAQKEAPEFNHIISEDENMLLLQLKLNRLVKNNTKPFSILLTGETGTGKTFLAKAIHDASGRKGQFVKVNAAAITTSIFESELFGHKKGAFSGADSDREGLFKAADGGTLFLDEIGEIDLNLQVKLLTAIEDGIIMPLGTSVPLDVNVLILFATNKNLVKAVDKGEFRQDLYYRINRFTYIIPPLRKRKKDIHLLANYFIKKHAAKNDGKLPAINISEDAQKQLLACKWLGNTRQLESVIEGILMLRDPDDRSDVSLEEVAGQLHENITNESDHNKTGDSPVTSSQTDSNNIPDIQPAPGKRKMPDKDGIEELLKYFYAKEGRSYGVIKKTANHIGVDQTNLSREIKKLGIIFP